MMTDNNINNNNKNELEINSVVSNEESDSNKKFKWYIVNVYSTFENKVVEEINSATAKQNLKDYFSEIIVPTESIVQVKNGKKVYSDRKLLPGYILIKMILNDNTWHLVKSIPRVTGFLGAKGRPEPLPKAEVDKILKQISDSSDKPKQAITFEIGEEIKIMQGPFATFVGVVEEVDFDKNKLKVAVLIFGRSTPVELDYSQVEKIN